MTPPRLRKRKGGTRKNKKVQFAMVTGYVIVLFAHE